MDRNTEVMGWLEGLAQDDWMKWRSDSEVQNTAIAALELLKEQEAVAPKKENDGNSGRWASWWYVCGNCSAAIDWHDRYCRHCGRAVKWE